MAENTEVKHNSISICTNEIQSLKGWKHKTIIISFLNTLCIYINSIIGVGIVTLPYIIYIADIPFAVISSALCCIIIFYTSDLMILTAKKLEKKLSTKILTYADLCEASLGVPVYYLNAGITFIMMFCAMCVYCVILRGMMAGIISDILKATFRYDKILLTGILVVFVLPICLLRDISKLSGFSLFSTILVVTFIVLVSVRSPEYYNLMKNLTPGKMLINEASLKFDRAKWVCNKAISNEDVYENIHSSFFIQRVKNFKKLFGQIKNMNICGLFDDPQKVIDAITNSGLIMELATDEVKNLVVKAPTNWSEAVSQAHSGELYGLYSLVPPSTTKENFIGKATALGVFSSAFIVQQGSFDINNQMKRKTIKDWRVVQVWGLSVVYILCMILAFSGYLSQKHLVGDTVFDKMKMRYLVAGAPVDYAVNIARIMLVLTILLTYPLQSFFARRNFFMFVLRLLKRYNNQSYDMINPPAIYFYTYSILQFVLTLVIGLYVNKIIVFYTLMGSLLASPLIYIIPTLCYLSHDKNIKQHCVDVMRSGNIKSIIIKLVIPVSVCFFGFVVMMMSTGLNIYKVVNGQ